MRMKRLFAIMLIAALGLTGFALADEADGKRINTLIEDGNFIIQVDVSDSDLAWDAYDMAQDDSVVRLDYSDILEDTFVARYAPVGDGDVTVGVRHFTGIACDETMTWNLHVEDGAVQDVTGGSHAKALSDADYDPWLLGAWQEKDTQFARMTIEKNPTRGWDVVIVSPVSHGAYVFKTSVLYDCELDSFVYDKGKYWDIDGEYDESASLGEARTAGTLGSFAFEGDEEHPFIRWYDAERPDETLVFERAD